MDRDPAQRVIDSASPMRVSDLLDGVACAQEA